MTIVLCNAGPLIALGKLNRLELLAELYGQVRHPARCMMKLLPADWRSACPIRAQSTCSGEQRAGPS